MLLFAIGLGGGIFTLLGFMGKVSRQFDLLSHFRRMSLCSVGFGYDNM